MEKELKCPFCGADVKKKSLKDEIDSSVVICDGPMVQSPFSGTGTLLRHIGNNVYWCPNCMKEFTVKK